MKRLRFHQVTGLVIAAAVTLTATTLRSQQTAPAQQFSTQTNTVSDSEMKTILMKALESDRQVFSPNIQVDVAGGVAFLNGSVSTLSAKDRALTIASKTSGVKQVVDELQVKPHIIYVDSELKRQVEEALQRKGSLQEFKVDVRDSFVVLRGVAASEEQKRISEQVVKSLVGVRGLENEIVVRPRPTN